MSRLREGRANTARGAAHFLRETVGRVRYGGARGQLTVRADSGFYAHTVVAACREMDVRFSITIRQRASLRDLIEAIPEEDWTPIPYWMDGAADVAETTYTPFQTKPGRRAGAAHCPAGEADARFPARPLRQIQLSRLHHRPRWGDAGGGVAQAAIQPVPPLKVPLSKSSEAKATSGGGGVPGLTARDPGRQLYGRRTRRGVVGDPHVPRRHGIHDKPDLKSAARR